MIPRETQEFLLLSIGAAIVIVAVLLLWEQLNGG